MNTNFIHYSILNNYSFVCNIKNNMIIIYQSKEIFLLMISYWGNHFLVITFLGRLIIGRSDSNFHNTFCDNSPNPSVSPCCMVIGKSSILTTDPKLKYITPCSELSINSCRSCTIEFMIDNCDLFSERYANDSILIKMQIY